MTVPSRTPNCHTSPMAYDKPNMPCAMRSPNIVVLPNSASVCMGFVSHVNAAKFTMSASVIVRAGEMISCPTWNSSKYLPRGVYGMVTNG